MTGRALVVFDLGRVLIRICDGWHHAFQVAGLSLPAEAIDEPTRARLLEHVQRIEVGDGDVDAFCRTVAGHLNVPCEAVTKMWNGYTLGPFDGAADLVDDLRAAGVTTACLSNTNERHWQTLTDPADPHGQVLARLDHRLASHLVRARKPDPVIYAHLEQATGFTPDRITFFDDVEENLTAARARGWRAHLVPRCENPLPLIRQTLRDAGLL